MTTTPTISMMDLRSQPGTILDRVFYRNERLVIERAGEPRAVLVPVREYEEMQRRKQEAKDRLFALIDTIQKRVSQYDPAQVQAAIDEAIKAVRQENHTRQP